MSDNKSELIKLGIAFVVITYEWWVMQPYHPPLFAAFWRTMCRMFQAIARWAGKLALAAEYNYYMAAEAGI